MTEIKRFKDIAECRKTIDNFYECCMLIEKDGVSQLTTTLLNRRFEITLRALHNIRTGGHGPTWAKELLRLYEPVK